MCTSLGTPRTVSRLWKLERGCKRSVFLRTVIQAEAPSPILPGGRGRWMRPFIWSSCTAQLGALREHLGVAVLSEGQVGAHLWGGPAQSRQHHGQKAALTAVGRGNVSHTSSSEAG